MTRNILYIFYVITILANTTDTFGYPQSFEKYVHITSNTVLFAFIAFFLFLRIKKNIHLGRRVSVLSKICFTVLITLTISLSTIDFFTPTNFVYASTRLNIDQIGYLSLLFGLTILINSSNTFLKKNWKIILFVTPPITLATALMIRSWPFDYFLQLVKEDHLVENTQFFVLLAGSIFAFLSANLFLKRKDNLLTLLFFLVGIGLFFIAGDEISWGQRLIGLTTPEKLEAANVQGEITFHNLSSINALVPIGYILIGFLGTTLWLLIPFLSKIIPQKYLTFLVPQWYLSGFFFTGFVFNLYFILGNHNMGEWSEPAELMLYGGISIWVTLIYLQLKHPKRKIIA